MQIKLERFFKENPSELYNKVDDMVDLDKFCAETRF